MKVGILTFHSQLNYGGVLQAWALKTAIETFGHEVVVIDRWLNPRNRALKGILAGGTFREHVRFALNIICLNGGIGTLARIGTTSRFIKERLNLTPYHFTEWTDAPDDLGVDCIVVGSDQVWNSYGRKDPRPYLLDGAPNIRAISYAASFGIPSIDAAKVLWYRDGFKRFSDISVREREGLRIVRQCGFGAELVLDPTLLVLRSQWNEIIPNDTAASTGRKRLVCYFIAEHICDLYGHLLDFACNHDATVDVYISHIGQLKGIAFGMKLSMLVNGRVRIRIGDGPMEFLRSLRSAEWVMTDSFHAVMFSVVFEKNVRVIRPTNEARRVMFSRIDELQGGIVRGGGFIVGSVREGVQSIMNAPNTQFDDLKVNRLREQSLAWLKTAIEG